ncbi:MAG: FAD-binding oxidoreductase [Candidatus Marinimicrobia bacterium]|jgi:D-lactate dehydrogenase|nr:FAD-binding oxidoreductase [Candidatus Neomarinimicrobiota bacterium]MBT3629899.1 FAD-binding oxidoreductase [Candidatus Neomarinimicrobiota bacterium]MBT3824481.1 FAD-binding oxidoreductase [Candidatus Neomarinimicrobiota bacterium]MBT4132760.1 FAD-binding oxidoreductase [Candidatus Neomarinimicrobiota bacterium]MBT4295351.1 FAD-binding oxidoreductase [Candidatus Neomarinimicrobiota bacterium]
MESEKAMLEALSTILPEDRIKARLIDRHSFARDASFYRLIPKVVVQPVNEKEIIELFSYSQRSKIPLVFRAAGTSLSGQSITDGILVEVSRKWQDFFFDKEQGTIQLEPGLIGSQVNRRLARYGRKIGPDPASLDACMIGGIIANNASGMCCGVKDNAYHTLDTVRFVLPNGQTYDTIDENSDDLLLKQAPDIHQGLLDLRERVLADKTLYKRVRDKYTRKNTQGYSLNALIDYEKPIDILSHLLVGSEGTLGFISKVRLKTLLDDPHKSAALLFFKDIRSATETVIPLQKAGAQALELMDRAALRSIQDEPGIPKEIKSLPEKAAALLCEFQAPDSQKLSEKVEAGLHKLKTAKLIHPADFTEEEKTRLLYWKLRKGLLPSVGAVRKSGTTVIIEDICFRLKDLADATLELQGLFKKHGYEDAIIFGHAKDGNLHFVISQTFADAAGRDQYEHFIKDVVEMTVGTYDGALKAEHGTGRNMAPFLETEWGGVAVEIMRDLKALIDPDLLLNPGVIINDDPEIYLKNIKPTPTVEAVVDKCIECGFCETWCPSKDLSMTPRQRIATWREIQLLQKGDFTERETAQVLLKDYAYESVDTCAVDGLCAVGCPVKIDTGDLTRHFRHQSHGLIGRKIAWWTVRYFSFVVEMIRLGLNLITPLARVIGSQRIVSFSMMIHRWSGGRIPVWHKYMPTGGKGLPVIRIKNTDEKEEMVYFASCLNRGMHKTPGETNNLSTAEAFIQLLQETGIHPIYPAHLEDLCCGTPYSSKGFNKAYKLMAENTVRSLWKTSQQGKLPVVVDTSPCTYKMLHYDTILEGEYLEQWKSLNIIDIIAYLNDTIIPRLDLKYKADKIILHPTCSTRKMGLDDKMLAVGNACAEEAVIPEDVGCCGFAGDRGFLVPELTEQATKDEAAEVRKHHGTQGHYSSSRTCEMGMSNATDEAYSSLIHLVHKAVFGN